LQDYKVATVGHIFRPISGNVSAPGQALEGGVTTSTLHPSYRRVYRGGRWFQDI